MQGAKVIVLEDMPLKLDDNITYVKVEDSNIALGIIAANFYDNPSEKNKTSRSKQVQMGKQLL